MASRVIVSTLDFFQYFFLLAAILTMAPFLGGEPFSAIFLLRCLILGASFFLLVKHCFFGSSLSDAGKKYFYKGLSFFFLFLLLILVQWLGRDLVQTRVLPGTLAAYRTIDLAIQLGFYILFLFSALDFFTSKKNIDIFTGLLWVQLGCLVALGFLQGFGPYKVSEDMYKFIQMPSDLKGFYASFPNPNHTGAYFSIASSFLIISIIYSIENLKRSELDGQDLVKSAVYFLLLPTMVLSEIYSQARTGFFLHLMFILIFTLIAVPKKHRFIAFVAIALLGGAYLLLIKSSPIIFPLEPFFKDIHKGLNYRFAIAGDAIHIFFNYPIFGTGLGSSKYVSAVYQKLDPEQFQWYAVINHHLELLFSSGIVGYLLFLLPIIAVVFYYISRVRESESYFVKIYGIGAFMAILLTGSLGSYIDDFLRVPAVAVLFIAHLAVLVNTGSGIIENPPESFERPKIGPAILFVGILVLSFLGAFSFITYESQRNMIEARNEDTLKLERSVALRSDSPEAWIRLGMAYQSRASLEIRSGYDGKPSMVKAIQATKRATQLTPLWSDAWLNLGQSQIFGGEYKEGFRSLRRAIELNPYNRDYRVYTLAAYLRVANFSKKSELRDEIVLAAKDLVDGTRNWARPITIEDHNYIGSINQGELRLSDQDRVRIDLFLEGLKNSPGGS